ncbi:unnamed protein product [Strongylus vulgaris]|uniref:Uncharacterized protein n=1 Tax=Strongylus vulgaris TaxID=40348 RepID=A0A3P7J1B0_STRVU|nr:unnamed protein product [Strongylus vulgaris]
MRRWALGEEKSSSNNHPQLERPQLDIAAEGDDRRGDIFFTPMRTVYKLMGGKDDDDIEDSAFESSSRPNGDSMLENGSSSTGNRFSELPSRLCEISH